MIIKDQDKSKHKYLNTILIIVYFIIIFLVTIWMEEGIIKAYQARAEEVTCT